MSRYPKNSIMHDKKKRDAMLRFLKSSLPQKTNDGRVGLAICLAWEAGYESGRRRARSASGSQS